jgi:tRNA pseudouridine32 synthase/23S rRNA pseudouridine746 synthase
MDKQTAQPFVFKTTHAGQAVKACDLLAAQTGLSKLKVKDAMNKGAVWIKKSGKMQRLRKATAMVYPGVHLEIHYDGRLLSLKPPEPRLVADRTHYSVWYKPAGLMAQGSMFGDHCSLLRQAELFFRGTRKVFLVHRIDREADGLMLIAHTREAAAKLSELFQKNRVIKRYQVEVSGNLAEQGKEGTIELPLDAKPAVTEFNTESYDQGMNTSVVQVTIKTGRLHQIRRHFEMIGHPVIGDPKYGKENKNREGMKLTATALKFLCPFQNREVEFQIPVNHG